MRRRRHFLNKHTFIIMIVIAFISIAVRAVWLSPSNSAEAVVDQFYSYEQKNNYSDSWELFHPFMQEKFPKTAFIQDRSHVFIGHFGAESFNYTVSKAKKVENWKAAKGEPAFKVAYHFQVTQTYNGKYGKFSFIQEVYTVKHKGKWLILWDYN
jgi:hypothetical protein